MNDIKDTDFTDDDFSLGENDRINNDSRYAEVKPVRGVSALKGIFNPDNKSRLVVICVVVIGLVLAIFYSFYVMDESDVSGGGAGKVQSGARVITREASDGKTSKLQRDAADTYNHDVLPERQKENPTLHPVLLTGTEDEEVEENPFATELVIQNGKVTEAPVPVNKGASSPAKSPQRQQKDVRELDKLLADIVKQEQIKPQYSTVEWTYASVTESDVGYSDGEELTDNDLVTAANTRSCNRVEKAGQMVMATADFALNSDVGGPVSLTIRNGSARGYQLLGSFERKEKWLRMELNQMVVDSGTAPIKAIGLDMDTTLNAVEGDLDSHILYRYGWWGFGSVLKAVGVAAQANVDQDVIIVGDNVVQNTSKDSQRELKMALGSLGEDVGSAFQDRINRPITVSLKVGDEVGIFFMEDACDNKDS